MTNQVPDRYRQVSVARVQFPLTEAELRDHLVGREAYRSTTFIVARSGRDAAVLRVEKASEQPLFSPITSVELLAGPSECAVVVDPDVDTGVPTQLAVAAQAAPGARCVVVVGRYHHVSFILDPAPIKVVVQDVIPPEPSKLVDQARRVLDVAEDLPPVEIVPDVIDLRRLIGDEPEILLPCMGAWDELPREGISYLDQRPEWRDWTLIGCARSQQIHRWFYGQPTPMRDFCPRARPPSDDLVLTRCCLIEEGIEVRDRTVFVPWGADLATVKEGLVRAVSLGCDRQRVDTAGEPASP